MKDALLAQAAAKVFAKPHAVPKNSEDRPSDDGAVPADGSIDVVGYAIEDGLAKGLDGQTIDAALGTVPASMLIVQLGASGTVRRALTESAQHWRAVGWRVDTEAVEGDENWWLVDDRYHDEGRRPMTNELIDLTISWIESSGIREPD